MKYNLTLTEDHIRAIGVALEQTPYRVAAPIIDEINRQLTAQQEADDDRLRDAQIRSVTPTRKPTHEPNRNRQRHGRRPDDPDRVGGALPIRVYDDLDPAVPVEEKDRINQR